MIVGTELTKSLLVAALAGCILITLPMQHIFAEVATGPAGSAPDRPAANASRAPQETTSQQDEQEEPPAVLALVQLAERLQSEGEFRLAAESWKELLDQHPQSSFSSQALFGRGKCLVGLNQPQDAYPLFYKLVQQTDADPESVWREPALLYAGYCQRSVGNASEAGSATWKQQLEEALATFDGMLEEFPAGKYRDQGLFLRGQTRDALGQHAEAAGDFQEVIDNFGSSQYYLESFLALGASLERLEQLEKASAAYQDFLQAAAVAAESQTATVANDRIQLAQFRLAETTLKRAVAERDAERVTEANDLFGEAETLFSNLYGAGYRPAHCLYQVGFCQTQLGKTDEAAATLAKMTREFPDSPTAADAGIELARQAFNRGELQQAYDAFAKLRGQQAFANEAAHWMCQVLIKQQKYVEAGRLAAEALGQSTAERMFHAELLLDRADAVYYPESTRAESIALYQAIVKDFPEHPVAPRALYNAAFTAQETGDPQQALQWVQQFVSQFSDHFHLPDVLQVKADALLQSKQYDEAATAFNDIVEQFPDNSSRSVWILRRSQAQYFGGKFDSVVRDLGDIDRLASPGEQARGWYWKAAAQFEQGQFAEALSSLQNSLRLDKSGVRSSEATLLLARTQFALDDVAAAIQTATAGLQNYGQFSQGDRFLFSLGEFQYAAAEYQQSAASFEAALKQTKDDSLRGYALYNLAWSRIKLEQFAEAIESFDNLLQQMPQHPIASSALLGRGMSHRQAGQTPAAMRDLQAYLDAAGTAEEQAANSENIREARFELALAQLADGQTDKGTRTLTELTQQIGDSPLAPKVLYELAWTYKENNDPQATDVFEKLATDFPRSSYAPEASFHVAEMHYEQKQYADAADQYRICFENSSNPQHAEMAMYKLGWCFYRQEAFAEAATAFRAQIERFTEGAFKTDALFMIGESLYYAQSDRQAVVAYRAALPDVEAADNATSKQLVRLNGARAANRAGEFDAALEFAEPLARLFAADAKNDPNVLAAVLEMGKAYQGQNQNGKAAEQFKLLQRQFGAVPAEAGFLLGEIQFADKQLAAAIDTFKLVVFGHGGQKANADVKSWQARAAYEIARCYHVQIADAANDADRSQNRAQAVEWYGKVVNNYQDLKNDRLVQKLVETARGELTKLQ